jgi:hypothetical protein
MKLVPVVALLSLVAFEASAASRYDIATMSCAQVQALIEKDGAAILRYPSKRILSLPIYDRYVQGQKFCETGEVARGAGVPTADQKYCPVTKCVASDIFVAR